MATLFAQSGPVSYTWKIEAKDDQTLEIIFEAKIEKGWYTYSQYLESDDGPVRTSVNFDQANAIELIGKATESSSKPENKVQGFDEMFEMNVIKYKHDLSIRQQFKVNDINQELTGYLEYMTCDDTKCMPPTAVEFAFKPADYLQSGGIQPEEDKEDEATDAQSDLNNAPVNWTIDFEKIDENSLKLIAKAEIAEGWYVYAQELESEDGPIATSINLNDSSNVEVWGDATESASLPEYRLQNMDQVFEMQLTKYKHDLEITKVYTLKDPDQSFTGFLEYMTCNAIMCMPPTAVEFEFALNPNAQNFSGTVKDGKFDPSRAELIRTNKAPLSGCGSEEAVINNDKDLASMGLLTIFILGFGGGLLALLTPCVFPMIPMTVSLFSKGKADKKEGIKNALVFGSSIIVIYVSLGLLITLLFGADALNLLSTHWLMNLIFFILFTVFAFSFFGYYEIQLPSSWANKADQASLKGGLIGTFFGAFSIALVSFSCTGPIVGTLLVQAAVNGGYVGPTIGMLGFSVALALPFTLFAAFPSWLQSMPNSGSWMTSMKVVLGFLELALGLKFLSTADLTEHWGILPYELFIALWALIFAGMTLYLFGLIKFPHDNPNAKISNARKGFALASLMVTVSIVSGFMKSEHSDAFRTPFWLSGLAPSACYSYINPCHSSVESSEFNFSDHCPPGISQCFDDYDEALRFAKSVNKPLLIDFTGFGCVNCRKMEENVWIDTTVNRLLNEEFVLVSLYVDDRKPLENILEGPGGNKIRNVGNKWAAFQEVNFDRQSQPYYVLASPDEQVLNKPVAYTPDIKAYTDFLNCGIESFESLKK